MLTQKQIDFLREELKTAKNPLFIHDDDADGLCAFQLLYRINREGKGIPLKTSSTLDVRLLRKVQEINPDKIFVLDIPIVDQEFIDKVNVPIFWIDHHPPLERNKVHYFNPRIADPNAYVPTTRMAWQISQNPDDLWIATAGCLADYHLPDFIDEFSRKYPEWVPEKADLPTTIFKHPISKLIRFFFFIQKGPNDDVHKSLKILLKIKSPAEIFNQETSAGKFLYKRFVYINQKYESLLEQAKKSVTDSTLFIFYYTEDQWSFTANVANELTSLYPQKIVIIARRKSGEMKCSIRAQTPIAEHLQKALVGINGYGGGHPNACGAMVKEEDWERFLENFRRELES
ncbi:MAG: DHH family phosphoesterase [Nanoarchaeota archaeon]|nr:DHH family phosphoesterase [Nanoarchaeota archaeon]